MTPETISTRLLSFFTGACILSCGRFTRTDQRDGDRPVVTGMKMRVTSVCSEAEKSSDWKVFPSLMAPSALVTVLT